MTTNNISYNKLWKLLVDRNIKKMDLKKAAGIGTTTLSKLSKNQPVAMDVLVKICSVLNCNIGDIVDVTPDNAVMLAGVYSNILRHELVPSLGCTEPASIAFAAAKAREILGELPERSTIEVSGNIIKNAKSVIVPYTNGMKGIKTAVAAGFIAGNADLDLEVLSGMKKNDLKLVIDYMNNHMIELFASDNDDLLYIAITVFNKTNNYVKLIIQGGHTNIVLIEKDGEVLFTGKDISESESELEYDLLNIEDIYKFAAHGDINSVIPQIKQQIKYNYAIAKEGLNNDWGAKVGKTIIHTYGNDIKNRAVAAAAAGSDARMSGCSMPVIIVSGSGNQGITTSVPVIAYAEELNVTEEQLYRALVLANLVTIHQKTSIGKLSAFCGAVSAGCGAASGIAFLLGGDYEVIAHTIVNSLAVISGIVCDGAKPSCAAKIAVAVQMGLLGHSMFVNEHTQFYGGDGIVKRGVDNTIANVGRIASRGMRETDREILSIMTKEN